LLEAFAHENGNHVEERSFFERVKEAFKAD
jgi:hypothetical protein